MASCEGEGKKAKPNLLLRLESRSDGVENALQFISSRSLLMQMFMVLTLVYERIGILHLPMSRMQTMGLEVFHQIM